MITDDTINIVVTHIGQRHIIPLQERQSGIVIFKVEGLTHSRRHLVNKAENTLIPAGAILIHE